MRALTAMSTGTVNCQTFLSGHRCVSENMRVNLRVWGLPCSQTCAWFACRRHALPTTRALVRWQVVGILKPSRLRNAVVGVLRSSRSDNGSGTLLLQPRNPRLPQMVVSLEALDMDQQTQLRQCAIHCTSLLWVNLTLGFAYFETAMHSVWRIVVTTLPHLPDVRDQTRFPACAVLKCRVNVIIPSPCLVAGTPAILTSPAAA